MGVTVDFLFAPSTPLTQREKQPGTGSWTQVIQNMAELWRLYHREQHMSEGRMIQKTCYLLSVTLLRFSEHSGSVYVKLLSSRNTRPPRQFTQYYFPWVFSLEMHFATNNEEGTSTPNYLAKAKWELEVMNMHGYHIPFPSYRSTTHFQAYWRDATNKTQQRSEEPQGSHTCFAPTANVLLRSAGRVGYTSTS